MTLVLCADDRGGLSFAGRRQSRDRLLCSDLLAMAEGRLLWVEPYSRSLFPASAPPLRTSDQPWIQAGPEDLCFLELQDPFPALERADRLVVYRWNRRSPFDRALQLPPAGWQLTAQNEFPGSSHKIITKEYYQP